MGSFRINFDAEEESKLAELRQYYGVKANTELIRLIINEEWKLCVNQKNKEVEK